MHRRHRRVYSGAAALIGGLALAAGGAAAPALAAPAAADTGTVISAVQGPFGPMLVVGSGRYRGHTLYFISSDDAPNHYGCTRPVMSILGSRFSCTGPSDDTSAEWPAITSSAAPVAGPGVNQALLGTVHRNRIGNQITYARHPLYLFETSPGEVTGEGWDEPSLPPWHGVWWLMSPAGTRRPGPGRSPRRPSGTRRCSAN
jgi:hypothetical protein